MGEAFALQLVIPPLNDDKAVLVFPTSQHEVELQKCEKVGHIHQIFHSTGMGFCMDCREEDAKTNTIYL